MLSGVSFPRPARRHTARQRSSNNAQRRLCGAILLVLAAAAWLPAGAAAQGMPGGGTSMREYINATRDYVEGKEGYVEQREGQLERMVNRADPDSEDLFSYTNPQYESTYDRGADIGDMVQNYIDLHINLLLSYFDNCGWASPPIFAGICVKWCFPFVICGITLYVHYFVPYQMVETVQVPFTSGYLPKILMDPVLINLSDLVLYTISGFYSQIEFMDLRIRSLLRMWGIDPPSKIPGSELDELQNAWSLNDRWRAGVPATGGYQQMDFHLMNTYFHEIWQTVFSWLWCHDGTQKGGGQARMVNPPWMSESPYGVLYSRFGWASYLNSDLMQDTMTFWNWQGAAQSCIERKYTSHTPDNIMTDFSFRDSPYSIVRGYLNKYFFLRGVDDDQYCLPGQLGPKGPFTNIVKDQYPAQAWLVADFRAHRVAETVGNQLFGNVYHECQYKREGTHPRDRFQMIHPTYRIDKDSCWTEGSNYTPDLFGPERGGRAGKPNREWDDERNEGDINPDEPVEDTWVGNWFVGVQWRYQRCCWEQGYSILIGEPPEIKN